MDKINAEFHLTTLIDQYQNLIFSVCYKLTQDYFAAQDLTQDTFLSAFEHAEDFHGGNEKAWLCRIASNKSIDYLRQAGRRSIPTEDEKMPEIPSTAGCPEHETLEKEVRSTLLRNCRSLNPPYDEIAYLYFYEEKKPAEIAAIQDKKLKTVQTQIYRARTLMRTLYQNEMERKGT